MKEKIDVANLRIGMYVEELDRPWLDTPFLFEGFYLRTAEDIEQVQQRCRFVFINTQKQSEVPDPPRAVARTSSWSNRVITRGPYRSSHYGYDDTPTFEEEVAQAKELRGQAKAMVDTMHEDIRKWRRIDVEGSKTLVTDMVKSIMRNPDALLLLTNLKNKDEYTAIHSMNVCVLALVFGRHLGIQDHLLVDLGLGGLLHDIGKMQVPLDVLNKPMKLTETEFEMMKQHPGKGMNMLLGTHGLPDCVVDVAYSHHERATGGGYPRGLNSDEISPFSKIVSIVDFYDALTSNRVYRQGQPSTDVLKMMYAMRGLEFDPFLVEQFIQCLGMFPAGSLVELDTGEVGLVVRSDGERRVKPLLMLILDANKERYYPLRFLDLILFEKSTWKPTIRRVLPPGSYGIDASDYAGGLALATPG